MFKVLLSELHHSLILMKWGWTLWMILYFMVSGTRSEVQVHQPPLLTATLGHDFTMPCRLNLSHDEKMMTTPVLYWMFKSKEQLVPLSDKNKERVQILDDSKNSSDKSILLKNVTWADSGKYLCKLSITTEKDGSFRKNGSESLLIVYDTMFFNLTSHNDSQLQCEVNVTRDPRIVLSIVHDGCKFPAESNDVTALPYDTLSETISSEVTVHQPPLLTAALGHDVIMPCRLSLSNNEKMLITPVLYWMYNSTLKVVPSSDKYKERVHILDSTNSSDKSILLKNVMWADSGKYLCKLSITTEDQSFRKKGNETLLIIHDTMFFNLTSHNDSQLQCEVNVTRDPRIVLSIFHDGWKFQTVNNAVTALPYNTLSETISLKGGGKYECQLHLNEDLIMKSIFHWHSPEPDVVFPEPWFLYMAMLLVPIIILLCLVIAMLKDRCCVVQHLAGTERRSKGESGCQQRKEMHLSNALKDMQQ